MIATNLYQVKLPTQVMYTQSPSYYTGGISLYYCVAKFRVRLKSGKIPVIKASFHELP